ncbi:MAG: enoyl-CoA hydratase/isomerase family protein [Pseudomonadota bacterium]
MHADIHFETRGPLAIITLDKQSTLNAVTEPMLRAIHGHLDVWERDEAITRVLIRAVPGKAFSAGGDIRHLYDTGTAGKPDFAFFAFEYALNARIARFPKPYLALVDGIAMGGGVGVSFHGSHRIGGDNLSFAMPEVGIGFFPDVGASYILNQLPGQIGLYLALTGARMNRADALWSGLATSGVGSDQIENLIASLCLGEDLAMTLIQFDKALTDAPTGPVQTASAKINTWFQPDSVSNIVQRLEKAAQTDTFAAKTLQQMHAKSPTSLHIAFEQMRRGRGLCVEDCLKMEYRILRRILVEGEFYEGIRATIIDKDNAPRWSPATLEDVDPASIERYFAPLGAAELVLP